MDSCRRNPNQYLSESGSSEAGARAGQGCAGRLAQDLKDKVPDEMNLFFP